MALPSKLFAVVSRAEPPGGAPRPKRSIADIREQKHAEFAAKKAIDRANALLDAIAGRRESLQARKAALDRQLRLLADREERISDRIIAELEAASLTRADGFRSQLLITPSPAAVEVVDANLLPSEFLRPPKPTPHAPDKPRIKAAIESGQRVPGARLVRGVTLRRS